jgi:hypothetical protein
MTVLIYGDDEVARSLVTPGHYIVVLDLKSKQSERLEMECEISNFKAIVDFEIGWLTENSNPDNGFRGGMGDGVCGSDGIDYNTLPFMPLKTQFISLPLPLSVELLTLNTTPFLKLYTRTHWQLVTVNFSTPC